MIELLTYISVSYTNKKTNLAMGS